MRSGLLALLSAFAFAVNVQAQGIAYDNVVNYSGFAFANTGATLIGSNTITRLVGDDITLSTGLSTITGFRFSVANLNATAVLARARVRFYDNNGTGGGPGTLLTGFSFAPINFGVGTTVFNVASATPFNTDGTFWAAITFDDNGGATGATAAQLNNLGQGLFNPPVIGSSTDNAFRTTNAGDFLSNNPTGGFFSFGGNPIANFGWQFTIQGVPEPSTFVLVGALGSGFWFVRKRRNAAVA